MITRVEFTDLEQADLTEMQALADSAVDNLFDMVKKLLFSSDYRVSGGVVNASNPASGVVTIDPGVFVKASGQFYELDVEATANILTGTPNPAAQIWGTGQAADATNPRLDIICVTYQEVAGTPALKNFVNPGPPVSFYTQTVNTRQQSAPLFAVVHGTPSATPAEPVVPSGYVKLATVTVPANATTVTEGQVANNLNINIKALDQLQFSSGPSSVFSDVLHGNGVYFGINGALAVAQLGSPAMDVGVATGTALLAGTTASVLVTTTVPITAASFFHNSGEAVSFASGDVQTLATNGTPPHKIRSGTVVVPGRTEGTDFSVQYSAGTITRLGGGGIAPGGSITVSYDYFLPRIDIVELLMTNGTPQAKTGTAAQAPVAPSVDANCTLLASVSVGEGVTSVVNANITDLRQYLINLEEVRTARGIYATLAARFLADEAATGVISAALAAHIADVITSSHAVHGIRQGAGNGFDADTVDGLGASSSPNAHKLLALDTNSKFPVSVITQGAGSGLDADTVDGIGASATPVANKLLALSGSAKFPNSVMPSPIPLIGNSLLEKLVMSNNGTVVSVAAELVSVQGVVLNGGAPISVAADITVPAAAGGRDTSSAISANAWYYVYLISNDDGTLYNAILSLTGLPTGPILPTGFTKFRLLGHVRTFSSVLIFTVRVGSKVYYADAANNPASLSGTNSLDLSSYIPPGCTVFQVYVEILANSGQTNTALARPQGSSEARIPVVTSFGNSGGVAVTGAIVELRTNSSQVIDVDRSGSSFPSLQVLGYTDPA